MTDEQSVYTLENLKNPDLTFSNTAESRAYDGQLAQLAHTLNAALEAGAIDSDIAHYTTLLAKKAPNALQVLTITNTLIQFKNLGERLPGLSESLQQISDQYKSLRVMSSSIATSGMAPTFGEQALHTSLSPHTTKPTDQRQEPSSGPAQPTTISVDTAAAERLKYRGSDKGI